MSAKRLRSFAIVAFMVAARWPVGVSFAQEDVTLEGGQATVRDASSGAYSRPVPSLGRGPQRLKQEVGEAGFLRNFALVPIEGRIRLGPTFNSPSCASCHIRNGRGALRTSRHGMSSDTVVKVSRAEGPPVLPGGPIAVPGVGLQVRDRALAGAIPAAQIAIRWESVGGTYGDGTPYELRFPRIKFSKVRRGGVSDAMHSLRRTPPIHGAGLLEAIPAASIQAQADPLDQDGNGISGRVNHVWDIERAIPGVGRFGFKAGSPTLRQQVAAAYATDMGVSNVLFRSAGENPEIPSEALDATTFYSATLGVPQARGQSAQEVKSGHQLFEAFGCAGCHSQTFRTGSATVAGLSFQIIHPFTDLLLHDMGPGLADSRPEFEASGQEWRTTPLWGIGLADVVLGRPATYLHDGRARSLSEAILWHGGEGERSRELFRNATSQQREDLIRFLRSL